MAGVTTVPNAHPGILLALAVGLDGNEDGDVVAVVNLLPVLAWRLPEDPAERPKPVVPVVIAGRPWVLYDREQRTFLREDGEPFADEAAALSALAVRWQATPETRLAAEESVLLADLRAEVAGTRLTLLHLEERRQHLERRIETLQAEAEEALPPTFRHRLKQLLMLAHPDRHGGSRLSTEVTRWLLGLKEGVR